MIYLHPCMITTPANKRDMPELIDQWKADRIAEGSLTAQDYVIDPATPAQALYAFCQTLQGKTDCIFFFGSFGEIIIQDVYDGHFWRRVLFLQAMTIPGLTAQFFKLDAPDELFSKPDISTAWADVSSFWTEGITVYPGKTPTDLYREYLTKRHDYAVTGSPDCVQGVLLDDKFGDYGGIGPGVRAQLTDVPLSVKEWSGGIDPTADGVGNDHSWEWLAQNKTLLLLSLTGGLDESPPAQFGVGSSADWATRKPRVCFFGTEASLGADYYAPNNLMRTAVCGSDCLAAFYIGYGQSPFSSFLSGAWTLGRLNRAFAVIEFAGLSSCLGDPTLFMDRTKILEDKLSAAQSALSASQAQVTTLQQQITSMGQANSGQPPSGTATPPPTQGTGNPPIPPPTPPAGTVTPFMVNCGSKSDSGMYVADTGFTGGNYWTLPGSQAVSVAGVVNAASADVYRTCRTDRGFSYRHGGYTALQSLKVRLHFAELDPARAGSRLTDIMINGVTVLTGFDPSTAAGGNFKAVVKEFGVTADALGSVTVALNSASSFPLLCALEILGG